MSTDVFALRRDFMQRCDFALPPTPAVHAPALKLWRTLLDEEWQEFGAALADYQAAAESGDIDALCGAQAELAAEGVDVLNCVLGLLLSQGLPAEAMFNAIHQANLDKVRHGVRRRADGKILKPAHWQPVDKRTVIAQARKCDGEIMANCFTDKTKSVNQGNLSCSSTAVTATAPSPGCSTG